MKKTNETKLFPEEVHRLLEKTSYYKHLTYRTLKRDTENVTDHSKECTSFPAVASTKVPSENMTICKKNHHEV